MFRAFADYIRRRNCTLSSLVILVQLISWIRFLSLRTHENVRKIVCFWSFLHYFVLCFIFVSLQILRQLLVWLTIYLTFISARLTFEKRRLSTSSVATRLTHFNQIQLLDRLVLLLLAHIEFLSRRKSTQYCVLPRHTTISLLNCRIWKHTFLNLWITLLFALPLRICRWDCIQLLWIVPFTWVKLIRQRNFSATQRQLLQLRCKINQIGDRTVAQGCMSVRTLYGPVNFHTRTVVAILMRVLKSDGSICRNNRVSSRVLESLQGFFPLELKLKGHHLLLVHSWELIYDFSAEDRLFILISSSQRETSIWLTHIALQFKILRWQITFICIFQIQTANTYRLSVFILSHESVSWKVFLVVWNLVFMHRKDSFLQLSVRVKFELISVCFHVFMLNVVVVFWYFWGN